MSSTFSVIIVDDHSIFRTGVAQTLELSPELTVVGEGGSVEEAIELAERLQPEVALIDLYMPGGGIEAVRHIHAQSPDIRMVVLTVSEEDDDIMRAFEAGASGYLLKGVGADELIGAVIAVGRGETYVSPALGFRLVNAIRSRNEQGKQAQLLGTLTPKEEDTLRLVGQGLSNREIAERAGVQVKTVKFHVSNLLDKLGLRNRVELALYSQKHARLPSK